MKKILSLFALAILVITCSKPDPIEIINTDLTGRIYKDTTLTADREWILDGRVSIMPGYTLTIEPGTIIKAKGGTGANSTCLIITNGAKINAVGTANEPIIFTSILENTSPESRGLWGGLLILGSAKGSFSGEVEQLQIEGIPANDEVGLYGGTNDHYNAGTLSYVSIRHGGSDIGEGNEINGLTLACLGDCTTINNIEVMSNADDGIELFGGTVNVENVLVWACADDFIDIDQGYSGTINNLLLIPDYVSDHVIEVDGGEGSYNPNFTITNCNMLDTIFWPAYVHFRDGASGYLSYQGNCDFHYEQGVNVLVDTITSINNENDFNWTNYSLYY